MKWKAMYFLNKTGELFTDDPTVLNKNGSRNS